MLADVKRAGLKLTPQRIALVRLFARDESHPTAQSLFERLRPAFPTMSFATVYNTLDALAKAGLSSTLRLGNAARFDPNTSPHHHTVCDACGEVRDVPVRGPEAEDPLPVRTDGGSAAFTVRTVERIYRGVCASCRIRVARPSARASRTSVSTHHHSDAPTRARRRKES
jgi:Fur family peroxide stress response transcriptional regulator